MKLDPKNPSLASKSIEVIVAEEVEYQTVARVGDVPADGLKLISSGPQPVVLAHVDNSFYAFEPFCPHEGAMLHEGKLYGAVIDCPRHHYTFDLCSGNNLYPKNVFPPDLRIHLPHLQTYPVRIEGDEIQVGFSKPKQE